MSVSVRPGELVAVAGPSGSGKSTLLACLAGLDEPDGGHVMIAGQRITRRDEATRAGLRARWIGMLLQSGNLIEHLSVAQNIQAAQALVPRAPGRGPRSRARRRQDGGTRPGAARLLDDVGLAGRASARPSTLSGGEAARAALAVAMANDPPVLLADEPTGEVDRQAEDRVLELLRGRADRGQGGAGGHPQRQRGSGGRPRRAHGRWAGHRWMTFSCARPGSAGSSATARAP